MFHIAVYCVHREHWRQNTAHFRDALSCRSNGNTVYYVCLCFVLWQAAIKWQSQIGRFVLFFCVWELFVWLNSFRVCMSIVDLVELGTYDYENAGHLNSTSILCANAQTFGLSLVRSLDWPIWIPNVWHQRLICRYFIILLLLLLCVCTCSCAKPSTYCRLLKPSASQFARFII